jgi:hypothetical protein
MYREKRQAQGLPAPPSPPPPPTLNHPLARELFDAGGKVIYEKSYVCWLVKHACGTKVTKFHRIRTRPTEAEAMRFVAEHTTIPVPRVYDVGDNHLTMEFIEGESLEKSWAKLSPDDQALVVRQLRDYVGQLRAIKSPDGRICSFDGGPATD